MSPEVKPWQQRTRKNACVLSVLSVGKALNQSATQLFCSGQEASVDEGVAIMDEVVIPCLHLMSRDPAPSQEDQEAMEGVRSHWCSCLSHSLDGEADSLWASHSSSS